MYFRLTQNLAKKIKETGPLQALDIHENPLADWSASLFTANRAQYVLLCNTATLYSCLFYGAGVNSDDRFIKTALQAIRETMEEDEALNQVYSEKIAPYTGEVYFGKAFNRSVTGSMNEQVNAAKFCLQDNDKAPYQVAERLNRNLLSYLGKEKNDYGYPRDAFLELCKGQAF